MYKDKEFQDNALRIRTLLKAKEVAEILQFSRAMAYSLIHRGEIPSVGSENVGVSDRRI